jgi:6-phosphogluconolactonase
MVVTGEEKAVIVKDILGEDNQSSNYPAGSIKPVNGKVEWFLDKVAASLLQK